MKRLVHGLLASLSRDARFQRLLERNVALSQRLMGIGSGSTVDSSGEAVLVARLRQLSPGAGQPLCVFDVGSNQGQFLDLIVNGLRDVPHQIHAFEPGRHSFERLSARAGGYSNVRLNNVGLGKERGVFDLFYDEPGSGLASLSKRRLDHLGIEFGHSERVRVETLDDYCKTQGIQGIDLLKLDVEGHELDVLQGGREAFQGKRIRMASFEFGGCNIDTRTYFRDFWHFFRENGMARIFRITPSGYLAPIRQYSEAVEQFRTTNFLVLRD